MNRKERSEKIQRMVENLTEAELSETELAQKLASVIREEDISLINDLPLLYRMEVKKVLQEKNEDRLASQIQT